MRSPVTLWMNHASLTIYGLPGGQYGEMEYRALPAKEFDALVAPQPERPSLADDPAAVERVARAIHAERANQQLFKRLPGDVKLPMMDLALALAALRAAEREGVE